MEKKAQKVRSKLDFRLTKHNWFCVVGGILLALMGRFFLGESLLGDIVSYGGTAAAIAGVVILNQIQNDKKSG